jgi:hypothetical protein
MPHQLYSSPLKTGDGPVFRHHRLMMAGRTKIDDAYSAVMRERNPCWLIDVMAMVIRAAMRYRNRHRRELRLLAHPPGWQLPTRYSAHALLTRARR